MITRRMNMKLKVTQLVVSGMIAMFGAVGMSSMASAPVYAVDCDATPNAPACQVRAGKKAAGANNDTSCGPNGDQQCTLGDRVAQVVNILLFIIGTISVIMIILGGIRYTISNGDSSQITAAKNTIMYAVIGLVVALLAYAIVNFVVTQLV